MAKKRAERNTVPIRVEAPRVMKAREVKETQSLDNKTSSVESASSGFPASYKSVTIGHYKELFTMLIDDTSQNNVQDILLNLQDVGSIVSVCVSSLRMDEGTRVQQGLSIVEANNAIGAASTFFYLKEDHAITPPSTFSLKDSVWSLNSRRSLMNSKNKLYIYAYKGSLDTATDAPYAATQAQQIWTALTIIE